MSSTHLCVTSYIFRDIKILNLWPPKIRSRSQSPIFQLHCSMTDAKICKCLQRIFALVLTVSEIQKFEILQLQKEGQGNGVQFSQVHQYLYQAQLCASSFRFRYIKFFKNLSYKRSMSRSTIFATTPFDCKC